MIKVEDKQSGQTMKGIYIFPIFLFRKAIPETFNIFLSDIEVNSFIEITCLPLVRFLVYRNKCN